ncbi:MAG: protein serine/threonine phosphatase, partial [Ilumatobacteraceae bacterium]|nr:protein serine/threonine phosphatase [Ilumatobacteraceae bacterium]
GQRLLLRRDSALALADDNARLYADQRAIAQSLQLSLLPQQFDAPPGATVTVRYWPAGSASLIGGDFYDVFQVDDQRWGIMIGDVCGKGIEAAGLTGLARHTVRAAARHERRASRVLHAVHIGLADQRPATFCTACFIYATPDVDGSVSLDLSLGGHPQPLLRRRSGMVEAVGTPGTLLGIVAPSLADTVVRVEDGDTLVLYTDGLTDAPGAQAVSVEQIIGLLDEIGAESIERIADDIGALKRSNRPAGSSDDTALVVIRFGVGRSIEGTEMAASAGLPDG